MKSFDTLALMRIIGLPHIHNGASHEFSEDCLLNFLPLAIKNRVSLLFLESALKASRDSRALKALYQEHTRKSRLALSLIREVSRILAQGQADYVIFKTFKPFPFVTVDVDTLLYTPEDFKQALHALRGKGFKLAGCGAYSVSLYSPKHSMNIDLQLEISISSLVYLNKYLLKEYVTAVYLDGTQVPVLEPPAALTTVLAHSLYKEQMFTLSDFYTIIIQMLRMTKRQRKTLVDLAEQARISLSIKAGLLLVNAVASLAFERNVPVTTETAQMIQTSKIEERTIQLILSHFVQNVELPYKYHPWAIAAAFATKIFRDPIMRGALAQQLVQMVINTSEFLGSLLLHMRRDTY